MRWAPYFVLRLSESLSGRDLSHISRIIKAKGWSLLSRWTVLASLT